MAAIVQLPGAGGRRPVDASLNVVPFIDLLSCCIAFLLITAVWTQMAAFEATPSGERGDLRERRPLTITVDEAGYAVASASQVWVLPRRGGGYDTDALAAVLARVHAGDPSDDGAIINAADGIHYEDLVRAMDVARSARFTLIAVGE